jgi:hypothetical protein
MVDPRARLLISGKAASFIEAKAGFAANCRQWHGKSTD